MNWENITIKAKAMSIGNMPFTAWVLIHGCCHE